MKKLFLGIGLLALIVQPGFAQEPRQSACELGVNGGWMHLEDFSRVNSFGVGIRFGRDRTRYLNEITASLWLEVHESHSDFIFFSLHVSRLFNLSKLRAGGIFFGPGVSLVFPVLTPTPHLKIALMIPLGKSIRIDLGFILLFFMPFPNISAGISVAL